MRVVPKAACGICIALSFVPWMWGCSTPAGPEKEAGVAAESGAQVLASDLDLLTGSPWAGTLTYLDYTSSKPTSIRSTMEISRRPAGSTAADSWELRIGYNDEPHANESEVVEISGGGAAFRGQMVTERSVLPDGTIRLVAEEDSEDNKVPARLRYVYLLSARSCSIQKLVRTEPAGKFFERHIYSWTR